MLYNLSKIVGLLLSLRTCSATLTITVPANVPPLPASSRAIFSTNGTTLSAPVTVRNSFILHNLPEGTYDLNILSRDWAFERGLVIRARLSGDGTSSNANSHGLLEAWRLTRGGWDKNVFQSSNINGDGFIEVRLVGRRDYYDERQGFNPISFFKSPMILIAVVGLAFVIGMPYLLDNMDPEMRKEFEEQQKKSILSGGTNTAKNPLQSFDMAAWMAGRTSEPKSSVVPETDERAGGPRNRRRA